MRILMLAQSYPPVPGGEERHVASLSEELVQRGHAVAVATLRQPGQSKTSNLGGVTVYALPGISRLARILFKDTERRHAPPFPDPATTLALRRLVRHFKPDIVHAHNWLVHSYLPLKRWAKIPLVLSLHDYSLACATKRLMLKGNPCSGPALNKCLACCRDHYGLIGPPVYLANLAMGQVERRLVDAYLPVSQATGVGNVLHAGAWKNVRIVPNFLPDHHAPPQPGGHPLTRQLPADGYLLFAGDLSQEKGIPVLLEAYARLEDAPPLVLIGRKTGTTPTELPPNVMLFNSWPHEAVLEAWARCSIALVPSVWPEPFGIVVIEAMAAGRPVIASNIGGLVDIVADGETGCLVPPGDAVALSQAIDGLLHDPARRAALGEAGRQHVAQFRANSVVPQIEQVYHQLLTAGSKNRVPGRFSGDGHAL